MANARAGQQGEPEALVKALGVKSLAEFRRADLSPELRQKVKLSAEDEYRLAAVAELHGAGVPIEVARALSFSSAIGSAAELASLSIEEVERVLQEAPVKRLLPENFKTDRIRIEHWLSLPIQLAADEEAPGRDALDEATEDALARDDDPARAAEDRTLSAEEVRPLIGELEQSWKRTQSALKRIADTAAAVDAETLRSALADLEGALAGSDERLKSSGEDFSAVDEDAAESDSVEDLDANAEIIRLQDEIHRMEAEIERLRIAREAWSEDAAAAAAYEEDGETDPIVETEE